MEKKMNNKLWINKTTTLRNENDKCWAELKIKDDSGDQYIDILIGERGKKPHIHMGINLDQSLRFLEPRGIVQKINKKIDSKIYGPISNITGIINNDIKGLYNFEVKFNIEINTNEVTIQSLGWKK